MNIANDFKKKSIAGNPDFLLCDITGNVEADSLEGQWTSSPFKCLGLAIALKPLLIAIRFSQGSSRDTEMLLDLCIELKRNIHTQKSNLLLLLHRKHRHLIEKLDRMKAEYLYYIGDTRLNSALMNEMIKGLGSKDMLASHLILLCPFLHYTMIDFSHEMIMCGAYLDRMVLGGRRLHEVCETDTHFNCEYFLKPRTAP